MLKYAQTRQAEKMAEVHRLPGAGAWSGRHNSARRLVMRVAVAASLASGVLAALVWLTA